MNDHYGEISRKLDVLIRLQAFALLDGKPKREQLNVLSFAGMAPKEISELLGTTANTVSVELHKLRKEKRFGPNSKKNTSGNSD